MNIKKLIPLLLVAVVFIAAKSDERSRGWFGGNQPASQATSNTSSSYGSYGTQTTASTSSASKATSRKAAAAAEEPADARASALSVLAKNPEALKSLLSLAKAMEQGNTQPAAEAPKSTATTAQKSTWR